MTAASHDSVLGATGPGYTVLIRRTARPGREAALEQRLQEILATGDRFPGYLGAVILRGGDAGAHSRHVILRFTDEQGWERWQGDADHIEMVARIDAESCGGAQRQGAEGLAGWFDLPGTSPFKAPPKWKMASITWLAIFPLLVVVTSALAPITYTLPNYLRLAVGTAATVPLMTWLVMPAMTRLFRAWLYRPPGR